jgi:hypothetical protein
MEKQTNDKSRARKWRGYAINALVFAILVADICAWQQRDMVSDVASA